MDKRIIKFLLTVMFLLSGLRKMFRPAMDIKRLTKIAGTMLNEKVIYTLIIIAGIWELMSVYLIHFGSKSNQQKAIQSLIVFTVLVTIMFHFPPMHYHYYPFISNVSTIGGLLCLLELNKITKH